MTTVRYAIGGDNIVGVKQGNETAVLTLTADPKAITGRLPLVINVSPTNQVLSLTINIGHK